MINSLSCGWKERIVRTKSVPRDSTDWNERDLYSYFSFAQLVKFK